MNNIKRIIAPWDKNKINSMVLEVQKWLKKLLLEEVYDGNKNGTLWKRVIKHKERDVYEYEKFLELINEFHKEVTVLQDVRRFDSKKKKETKSQLFVYHKLFVKGKKTEKDDIWNGFYEKRLLGVIESFKIKNDSDTENDFFLYVRKSICNFSSYLLKKNSNKHIVASYIIENIAAEEKDEPENFRNENDDQRRKLKYIKDCIFWLDKFKSIIQNKLIFHSILLEEFFDYDRYDKLLDVWRNQTYIDVTILAEGEYIHNLKSNYRYLNGIKIQIKTKGQGNEIFLSGFETENINGRIRLSETGRNKINNAVSEVRKAYRKRRVEIIDSMEKNNEWGLL